MKLKTRPQDGVTPSDLSFDNILSNIIIGPSVTSPISAQSMARMIDVVGKSELKDRIVLSSIPFRTH